MPDGRHSVLLVEDERAVRTELRELLEEEGYRVVEAANGQEAMAALDRGMRPAVVLLDLMMPVMDGWHFIEALAACGRRLPIVVASAAEPDGLPVGIARLRKPFCVQPLLDTLAQRCGPPALGACRP